MRGNFVIRFADVLLRNYEYVEVTHNSYLHTHFLTTKLWEYTQKPFSRGYTITRKLLNHIEQLSKINTNEKM